ncbi:stress response protein NST1 isoform X2 [Daucus carota subsp. sativus]|uniref:stress response protein NST1 isoform X2 n=1 Tax=Daucus carota subsp. sativus TaxID=79200 RepID=UPI003082B8D8
MLIRLMERDEERWKKFKEDQRKRLRDIEEQSVPEMTDLEILAGKRRIKLQGSGQDVFKSYSHLVGDHNPLTLVPVMSETSEKTASEISKKLDQHTQKPRARYKAQVLNKKAAEKDDLNLDTSLSTSEALRKIEAEAREKRDERNKKRRAKYKAQKKAAENDLNLDTSLSNSEALRKIEAEAREKRDERNNKRREKYKAQKEACKKDGLNMDFEAREKRDQLNQKRRARYKAQKEATLKKIELEAKEKHDHLNQKRLEVKKKKRRSRYQNGDAEKREERRNKRQQVYRNENEEQNMKCDASKVIVRTPEKFAALPTLSKRMRSKIKLNKEKFASSNSILDIGCADKICCHCGALMWRFEQTEKECQLKSDKFSLCCGNGKVRLPLLRETPFEMKTLLDRSNPKRTIFQNNIRMYNNAFGSNVLR